MMKSSKSIQFKENNDVFLYETDKKMKSNPKKVSEQREKRKKRKSTKKTSNDKDKTECCCQLI